jgi:hypothetical protein
MAIEIRELVIKATITGNPAPVQEGLSKKDIDRLRKELVKECVDLVIERIEEKTAR